ncbi:MAG: polyprenyl synthetase family protein [Anaerolineae bacterium]|jgi:geranylgeranyl diphosphate synthase type I|nr:polyprenyl synthetase family protein [Anaerolineae bacterium]
MTPHAHYASAIEAELRRNVALQTDGPPLLLGMIRYHMGWVDQEFRPTQGATGKRIRPAVLLLAAESVGGCWERALPAAAAVELLHNFTLIHDDIEDRDTLRRGRPTLWSLWGIPQAINAGDALYAMSYRALLSLADHGVPHDRVVIALSRYTEAVVGITEGQCLDLAFEDMPLVDEASYLKMVAGKTARLTGLAAELGAVVVGSQASVTASLRVFGEALGMAFQMLDDILGLWGDPSDTGKPVGSDILKHKKTLPILHGLLHSAELRDLLARPELGPGDVQRAMDELAVTRSRAHTEARAAEYHRQALEALDAAVASGPAREVLVGFAEQLLARQR